MKPYVKIMGLGFALKTLALVSGQSIHAAETGPINTVSPTQSTSLSQPSLNSSYTPSLSPKSSNSPTSPNQGQTPRDVLEHLLATHGDLLYEIIVAVGNNAPQDDIEALKRKALANAGEIADSIGNLYGYEGKQQIASLLEQHLQIGSDYLNAVKLDDQTLADQTYNRWLAQAREIANFLSTLIPTLSNQSLSAMWDQHIHLEAQLILAYFQEDKQRVDQLKDQSMMQLREMADLLTSNRIHK